jgi:hypothetical protein
MLQRLSTRNLCSICIWLVDGDLSRNLQQLCEAIERFQQEAGSHFGCSDQDLRQALVGLAMEHQLMDWRCVRPDVMATQLANVQLHQLVPLLLRYTDVAFDGEGQYWNSPPAPLQSPFRQELDALLGQVAPADAPAVRGFLEERGLRRDLLRLHLEGELERGVCIDLLGEEEPGLSTRRR